MADEFFGLSPADRLDALEIASAASGRRTHLLEKDVWVVWALDALFGSHFGSKLVFKGGTSLSKAYGVIRRFSEDIDLTYDIRAIAPDLTADNLDAVPTTRSQGKKWSDEIKIRLARWVRTEASEVIESAFSSIKKPGRVKIDNDTILIEYEPMATGTGYSAPTIKLEFGARSTGEPWEHRKIVCDAARYVPQLRFPSARPQVMQIERTFWEKATAMHVFCVQGRFRGAERFARHWHDVARMDETGHAAQAVSKQEIAQAVARHKAIFFRENDADGSVIDYAKAVTGGLRLVPEGAARTLLADDYRRMMDDGLLLDEDESFEALIERCRRVEQQANRTEIA